jgi:hypothetical protein
MTVLNGRLPESALVPVGGGLFLQREAAASFLALQSALRRQVGRSLGLNAAYRSYAKQQYLYNGYVSHQPGFNLAAYPGMSNHGWGLAIDLASPADRQLVDRFGARYGWAKRWSDAPSEWWHIKFNAPIWRANKGTLVDPFAALLSDERRWLTEYTKLKSANADRPRRRTLWKVLRARRKDIWRQAQKSGWNADRRAARYRLIRHYIGG